MDQALWLLRVILMSGGSALTARGIGDEATWEAVAGGTVALTGVVWSHFSRKRLAAAAS